MRPSLYPPAPSTCSAVRFTRAVPIALSLGCLGSLAAGQHRERNVPSCPGCRSTWAGAPAYGGLVLCLCATLTIATDVAGTRRFRHVSHVSKPSLSRGSIAKKESRDPGASAVEQARYSSELRTDGAGSVTLSGCHCSGHARTVGIEASLGHSTNLVLTLPIDENKPLRATLLSTVIANWAIKSSGYQRSST